MATLLADFIIEEYAYVNENLDDFTWEGADVHPYDANGSALVVDVSFIRITSVICRKKIAKYMK